MKNIPPSSPDARTPVSMHLARVCPASCLSFALLVDLDQELGLQDELALFILLGRFICLLVFPTDNGLALLAGDVSDHVSASRHVPICLVSGFDVDYILEEEGFTMLTAEVLYVKSVERYLR